MDTGIDLNTQTNYKVKQSGPKRESQDIINSILEKKEKLKEIIINLIVEDLRSGSKFKNIKNDLKFDVVGNTGIAIYKGNIESLYKYSKVNGIEFLNGISSLKKNQYLNFGENESGYKLNNGKINIYFIEGIENINFHIDMQYVYGTIKAIESGKTLESGSWLKTFNGSIVSGAMRIKDVMYFTGKGYITDKDFPKLLVRAIQELPNQSSDIRFYKNASGKRMGMEVTKQELSQYLKPTEGKPLITQEMYEKCIKLVEKRDELIRKKEKAKESTKLNLKREKEKKGFLDKVYDLLGW